MLQSFNANILSFIFLQFLCLNHLKKIIQVNTLQQLLSALKVDKSVDFLRKYTFDSQNYIMGS